MLYVGTSGWAYGEWKGGFYPSDLPQRRFLEFYSRALGACEVNTTFYRLHSTETLASWAERTPSSFRFAVKAHRRLTHVREIGAARDAGFLRTFLQSLAPLGDRFGCALLRFPDDRERDDAGLDRLLSMLPAGLRFAIEFREESWDTPAVAERIAAAGGTVCFADTLGPAPEALPPGLIAYVRLRADRYGQDERANWLALLEQEAREREVYAFAKHEGVPAGDPHAGVGLAQWLVERSGG